jgi:hypothetical protein
MELEMNIVLTDEEIRTLLASLEYSKQRVRDASDTPYEVRQDLLSRLDAVSAKLRGSQ